VQDAVIRNLQTMAEATQCPSRHTKIQSLTSSPSLPLLLPITPAAWPISAGKMAGA
jgi:hypothetical protein